MSRLRNLSRRSLFGRALGGSVAAATTLTQVKSAISTLGGVQNTVGTLENRLQFAVSLAQSQTVNTQAAESRIRDANVAQESANMTRYNILSQAGIGLPDRDYYFKTDSNTLKVQQAYQAYFRTLFQLTGSSPAAATKDAARLAAVK